MKASKPKTGLKTGFQQQKTGLPKKNGMNIPRQHVCDVHNLIKDHCNQELLVVHSL